MPFISQFRLNVDMQWSRAQPDRDLVLVENLRVNADIGPDCWNRSKVQPLLISFAVEADLSIAGQNDDLTGSIDYGRLTKDILARFVNPTMYPQIGALAEEMAKLAIAKTDPTFNVKVSVTAPKMLLQDATLTLEVERVGEGDCGWGKNWKWIISSWRTPVLIGLNSYERNHKQLLVLDMQLFQGGDLGDGNLSNLMNQLEKFINTTEFLTLEKFATELIWEAMRQQKDLVSVTIKVSKPSSNLHADANAVQIRRNRPPERDL